MLLAIFCMEATLLVVKLQKELTWVFQTEKEVLCDSNKQNKKEKYGNEKILSYKEKSLNNKCLPFSVLQK